MTICKCTNVEQQADTTRQTYDVIIAGGGLAGVCAATAVAVDKGKTPREMAVADVQAELRRQGVKL